MCKTSQRLCVPFNESVSSSPLAYLVWRFTHHRKFYNVIHNTFSLIEVKPDRMREKSGIFCEEKVFPERYVGILEITAAYSFR